MTINSRVKKYMDIETAMFPNALYVNHSARFLDGKDWLKIKDMITVKHPIARRRLYAEEIIETIFDIEQENAGSDIAVQKLVIEEAKKIIKTAEREYGIDRYKWIPACSGKSIHLHLITNIWRRREAFEIELVNKAGVPLKASKVGLVGVDKSVIGTDCKLIKCFGGKNINLEYYKTHISVDELFEINEFPECDSLDKVRFPEKIDIHLFERENMEYLPLKFRHIETVLEKEANPCHELRGSLVLFYKYMRGLSAKDIITHIVSNAQWVDRNETITSKQVNSVYSLQNVLSEKRLNEKGYTYYKTTRYDLPDTNVVNEVYDRTSSSVISYSGICNNNSDYINNTYTHPLLETLPTTTDEYDYKHIFRHLVSRPKDKKYGITFLIWRKTMGPYKEKIKDKPENIYLLCGYILKRHGRGVDYDVNVLPDKKLGEGKGSIKLMEGTFINFNEVVNDYCQRGFLNPNNPITIAILKYMHKGSKVNRFSFEIIKERDAREWRHLEDELILQKIPKFKKIIEEYSERGAPRAGVSTSPRSAIIGKEQVSDGGNKAGILL